MLCFKRKFSQKSIKIKLNLCFTADLHHLQDHFSNFLLNFSSLAKKKMQKERFEGKKEICAAKYAIA